MQFHPDEVFINGQWVAGEGKRIDVVNPATEQVIGHALDAAPAVIDRAVAAARSAFDSGIWSERPLAERVAIFEKLLALLDSRQDELTAIQTAQMGVPTTVSRAMIASGSNLFRAYVDGATAITYSYLRRDIAGQSLIKRVPVGVVGAITPWNGPLATVMNKAIPAMLAGCTVVLKPAPQTPLEAGIVAELCIEAGIPPGVFNVVTGGAATGEALVVNPQVDKVTFTGSTTAGRRVGELAGHRLKRQSLELGGKSAGIILQDADLDRTIPEVVMGNFFNSGQACIGITRILAHQSVYSQVVERLKLAAESQVIGDPTDARTQLGPVVNKQQYDRITALIEAGKRAGAAVVTGGGRPDHLEVGYYIAPTVFAEATNDMPIARQEIFGPVVTVIPFQTEDEAVAIANDSEYGLHGAVFAGDVEHALAIAERIHTGSVGINGFSLTPGTPYGGVKGSGVGREHGTEGVAAFLEYKSYVLPVDLAAELEAAGTPVA